MSVLIALMMAFAIGFNSTPIEAPAEAKLPSYLSEVQTSPAPTPTTEAPATTTEAPAEAPQVWPVPKGAPGQQAPAEAPVTPAPEAPTASPTVPAEAPTAPRCEEDMPCWEGSPNDDRTAENGPFVE